uniref:WRKY19-like zinc finger domain-containing protein n=1 Tax=Hyaloperonospora arabidopsidis (strain Emoy2) TaxID=559515 RepID=M4BAB2_HYAAE
MQGGGVAMFVDSFLPEDDPTLYSLWTAPGNSDSVLGYETESTPHHHHQEQGQEQGQNQAPEASSSLYLTSDDELKIDYPHLSEFHQDLDSYLNETMESGGPSPTTPLGTHTNCSMKMDRLVTIDRKSGNGHGAQLPMGTRESLLEKSLVSATAAEHLVKRERATTGLENVSERLMMKSRGGRVDPPYAAVPVGTSPTIEAASRETVASSYRTLPQNLTIEPKQRVELHHGGRSPLITAPATTSQTAGASDGTVTLTSTVTSTSATSGTSSAKAKKRPRSRQCEFPGCQNRARSHQKCKKHGGAHHCVFEGCTKNSQSRGLCIAHGGGSRCKKEGCIRAAQSKGLCKSHGGGEYCAVEGCNKKAHLKHLCRTHGGGVRCRFDKCSKWAQRKGWCMAHAKEFASS